jgi:hypothetical protein
MILKEPSGSIQGQGYILSQQFLMPEMYMPECNVPDPLESNFDLITSVYTRVCVPNFSLFSSSSLRAA